MNRMHISGKSDVFKQARVETLLRSKKCNLYDTMRLILQTNIPLDKFLEWAKKYVTDEEAYVASDYRVDSVDIFLQYYHFTQLHKARKKRQQLKRELDDLDHIRCRYYGRGVDLLLHEIGIRKRQLELARDDDEMYKYLHAENYERPIKRKDRKASSARARSANL